MSTKTNFKRVALVAVAALGLGVLTSVAPASASSVAAVAAGFDADNIVTTGTVVAPADDSADALGTVATITASGSVTVSTTTGGDAGAVIAVTDGTISRVLTQQVEAQWKSHQQPQQQRHLVPMLI